MVKTEDVSIVPDDWREVFERTRLVPPPSQTVRLAVEHHLNQSSGFQLILSRVTAPHLTQVTDHNLYFMFLVHAGTITVRAKMP